ncbi:MAG: isocitrate/isopropylmalate dehydrogenase family protein, partial [Nitrososphaeria archaeon]|nr:isocitrate/isopropylmalate dehydrogenase family protein [Nitrososphaeria archaeon]
QQHNDSKCAAAAAAIEDAMITTLKKGVTVPDFGGKATTIEVGEAVAEEIMGKRGE